MGGQPTGLKFGAKSKQEEVDLATMRIENPNITGSGYIQYPPQRPFQAVNPYKKFDDHAQRMAQPAAVPGGYPGQMGMGGAAPNPYGGSVAAGYPGHAPVPNAYGVQTTQNPYAQPQGYGGMPAGVPPAAAAPVGPPARTRQEQIDMQTAAINNPNVQGSGFIQYGAQVPGKQPTPQQLLAQPQQMQQPQQVQMQAQGMRPGPPGQQPGQRPGGPQAGARPTHPGAGRGGPVEARPLTQQQGGPRGPGAPGGRGLAPAQGQRGPPQQAPGGYKPGGAPPNRYAGGGTNQAAPNGGRSTFQPYGAGQAPAARAPKAQAEEAVLASVLPVGMDAGSLSKAQKARLRKKQREAGK